MQFGEEWVHTLGKFPPKQDSQDNTAQMATYSVNHVPSTCEEGPGQRLFFIWFSSQDKPLRLCEVGNTMCAQCVRQTGTLYEADEILI